MTEYAGFSDAMGALFQDYNQKYEALRVRYHILQVDQDSGAAMVEFTLEAVPAAPTRCRCGTAERLKFTFPAPEKIGRSWTSSHEISRRLLNFYEA